MENYQVKIKQFEGPFNLLLDLIEERKLSINEISLAEVSSQYLDYLRKLPQLPRAEAASFLVVAAALILIKSKSLLPSFELTGEEEESIEDLKKRLELYKKMRQFSFYINSLYGKKIVYKREAFLGVKLGFIEPKGIKISALCAALKNLMRTFPAKEIIPEKIIEKVVKLEDKIDELRRRMEKMIKTSFREFAGFEDKTGLVVSFLAMLELVKLGAVAVIQKEHFGDIEISKSF
ncbi:MAG: segregation/condensation protein A [Candidatus Niyogibacteria bacterium]|nr:segregation/condensation protein A [Candidatus Niyogibacteria bacterium]